MRNSYACGGDSRPQPLTSLLVAAAWSCAQMCIGVSTNTWRVVRIKWIGEAVVHVMAVKGNERGRLLLMEDLGAVVVASRGFNGRR